jgi:hypothetical protein
MGAIQYPQRKLGHIQNGFSPEEKADLDAPEVWPEVDALIEKIQQLTKTNQELRALVTQLSVVIIRNVVDRK